MAAAAEPKDEGEEEVKGIKMSEVEKHSSIDDLWLVIDGRGGTRLHHFGGRKRRGGEICVSVVFPLLAHGQMQFPLPSS